MEYGGDKMKTNNQLCALGAIGVLELPYNGYDNLYQAMCVHHDWIESDIATPYNPEELALEVV